MKKSIIRTKLIVICLSLLALFLILLLISTNSAIYVASANDTIDTLNLETLVHELFGDKHILSCEYLYNFNDSPDYIYVNCETGYAIYFADTLELLEYSPNGSLPYLLNEKKYYNGPTNYFHKNGAKFVNTISNEQIKLSDTETELLSNETKSLFSSKRQLLMPANPQSITTVNIDSDPSHYNIDELEEADIPGTAGTKYIQNHQFFTNIVLYGVNETGTCSAVASQLLLTYNNYYNDRRIIADKYLYGWDDTTNTIAEPEYNPNYCSDPFETNIFTLSSTGRSETIEGTYFYRILQEIPRSSGANIVSQGLENILNERNQELSTSNISFDVECSALNYNTGIVDPNIVKNEINSGRPLYLAIRGKNSTGENSAHAIVAYGYQEKNSTMGYISHFGWTSDTKHSRVWTNSAWCYQYVTLKINHEHSYGEYVENKNEVKCLECRHRNVPYTTENLSSNELAISSTRIPICGKVILPSTLNGKAVTKIADSTFANQNISEISIPSSVKEIGIGAFQECQYLNTVEFTEDTQIKKIADNTFYNCIKLKDISIPLGVLSIGKMAFYGCESFMIDMSAKSLLKSIGDQAFNKCSSAISTIIPATVETIGSFAFANCTKLSIAEFGENSQLKEIGAGAFALSGIAHMNFPTTVTKIGDWAFLSCPNLVSVLITNSVQEIGFGAFSECPYLTVYCQPNSIKSQWDSTWIDSDRPVIWGCSISQSANPYVLSFTKSDSNPKNIYYENGISKPYHNLTDIFDGWYTTSDFSGTKYEKISSAPNGVLYAKWGLDSCIAEGSLITLADGSTKAVEELTGDETLLVWDMYAGTFASAPILFIDRDERAQYEVINLNFSDGTAVKVISEHAFWDIDLRKYVYLRNDAARYIGHRFNKQSVDENGNMINAEATLMSVVITEETTVAYSPVTYGHLCYYVNGMLTMPGATEPFANIFEVDGETMAYDKAAMEADIEQYGLYTYEEFAEILPVSEEVFDAFNGQYLKVAIGKGLTDIQTIAELIARYSDFLAL